MILESVEVVVGALVGLSWVLFVVASRVEERLSLETRVELGLEDLEDPRSVEEIKLAYSRGELSEEELERRLAIAVDPRTERIRDAVEPVSGVGPKTALSIAERFDSERELARASREELEEVPNVGPERADAIRERL